MTLEIVIRIAILVISALVVTIIPGTISLVRNSRKYKEAKTDSEKQAIYLDMIDDLNKLIISAEEAFISVDTIVKQQGGTGSGAIKKENVLAKLQGIAIDRGIKFDAEFWSQKIDELIELTKKVNARK